MVRAIQRSPTNNLQIIQRQANALGRLRFEIGLKLNKVNPKLTPDELGELLVFVLENAISNCGETALKTRLNKIRGER